MAPPTNAARLHEIDPEAFAAAVADYAAGALNDLSTALGLGRVSIRKNTPSPVRGLARRVATFARSGEGYGSDVARAEADVLELDQLLLMRGVDVLGGRADRSWRQSHLYGERTALGVVMLAAKARVALLHKEPVPSPQLAALVDISRSRVGQMVRRSEIRRATRQPVQGRAIDAPILWMDARRLVVDRRVAGYEAFAEGV